VTRNIRRLLTFMCVLVIIIVTSSSARASMMLRLTSGADVVTVEDGGVGDAYAAVGAITFIGSVGDFVLNVTTGLSKGAPGGFDASSSFAKMDLNDISSTSNGPATLKIELTDTDFPAFPTNGVLTGDAGGTLADDGTIEFWAYKNDSNREFDIGQDLPPGGIDVPEAEIHLGPFESSPFSGTASVLHGPINNPYSMTLVTEIAHQAAGSTSFDFEVRNVVPEPSSLLLLGTGVIGLVGFARWRRRRNVA
jgi:hypothetical protein